MVTYFKPLGHRLEICDPVGTTFTRRTGSLRSGCKCTQLVYMAASSVGSTRGNTKFIRRVGVVLSTLDTH